MRRHFVQGFEGDIEGLGDTLKPRWLAAAHRLRMARQACSIFLDCWTASRVAADPQAVQRMAQDLAAIDAALADPENHDWSMLYRGSVLDD
ncbi:MAG: hypothetical protein ABSF29_05700 [Tepidisphaeraceae bacterium]|jgi:hypothetical protein